MYTFVPNKPFGSLLEISPENHIFLKAFNSEYSEIKVWFTDQNNQPYEIEDRINLTLIIKLYKCVIQLSQEIEYMWIYISPEKKTGNYWWFKINIE